MLMKSIPRFISVALVTSFLFSFITPSVYATDFQEYDYWTYWYVEQSTGVSAEDVTSTDSGISNGEFIASNGGGTRQDAYDWIKDKYDNATNATAKGIDYYYNAVDDIYNKSVDYAVQGYYTAENALRKTVDTAGKTVYNVSSSDFWSGFYNQMYNGGGYKDQYTQTSDNSYDVSVNGQNYSISLAGFGYAYGDLDSNVTNGYSNFNQGLSDQGGDYQYFVFSVVGNGKTVYVNSSRGFGVYNQWQVDSCYNFQFSYSKKYTSCTFNFLGSNHTTVWDNSVVVYFSNNVDSGQAGGTPVLQPSQMGFIIDPLTGDKIPVYTDPTQNPFRINPNGTVTIDGTDYPIYVDPEDISDDGWLWILDYIDKENSTKPSQNPYGKPWNTQNDGTVLGGLFNGLIEDISSLFDKISSTISDLISKLLNIILDALKKFIIALVGDTEGYSNLFESSPTSHFDIVEDLYDLLLQCMGVNS